MLRWAVTLVLLIMITSTGLLAQSNPSGGGVPEWLKNNWWAIVILIFHVGGTYQEFRYVKTAIKELRQNLDKFDAWKDEFLKDLPEDFLTRREAREKLSSIERKQSSMSAKMDAMNNKLIYLSGGREQR